MPTFSEPLTLVNGAGSTTVAASNSDGSLTLGGGGTGGELFLRNAAGQTVGSIDADTGDMILGNNGQSGDILLRDASGTNRVRLDADDQRLEVLNASGQIIGMLGGAGNIRAGTNGLNGNLFLYPSTANDIFNNGLATIHLDANAGDITLRNADCAEEFEVLPTVCAEPGTVMALGDDGRLRPSARVHETAVVGVVPGAGDYQPGIVLDKQPGTGHRRPIALVSKTYVKVTDEGGPIRIGDPLTTSSTEGHAMRVTDRLRVFGAVIGKAIAPLDQGTGLVPMVIAWQ